MTEPTIDEMLLWLDGLNCTAHNNQPFNDAVKAILERHADGYFELEAIRAFVERVEKRANTNAYSSQFYWSQALREELAAMEKEAE